MTETATPADTAAPLCACGGPCDHDGTLAAAMLAAGLTPEEAPTETARPLDLPAGHTLAGPRPVRPVRLALAAAGMTVGRSLTVGRSYAHPGAVLVTVHELHDDTANRVAARVADVVTAAGYTATRPALTARLVYVAGPTGDTHAAAGPPGLSTA